MSLPQSQQAINSQNNGALLEKVILCNDLSGLSPIEKVEYVKNICHSIGLNPLTKPIQLMKFQGKEIPYFTKDATEQLRKINKISITNLETKILDGLYIVTATALNLENRQDSSTGVISISGLKGDALSNAMMKAETKAKRRVTLSICGLGFIDELEVDSIINAKKIDIHSSKLEVLNTPIQVINEDDIKSKISECKTMEELENVYRGFYKEFATNRDSDGMKILIDAKDAKKMDLEEIEKFRKELNEETGEVIS